MDHQEEQSTICSLTSLTNRANTAASTTGQRDAQHRPAPGLTFIRTTHPDGTVTEMPVTRKERAAFIRRLLTPRAGPPPGTKRKRGIKEEPLDRPHKKSTAGVPFHGTSKKALQRAKKRALAAVKAENGVKHEAIKEEE